eukprot:TRINITY_DN6739_c0_g1_i2.p1 TRINITY_DN6739_c0_g1~~TRINITY_DN6739_c0_g1_i2.p1  ORF type:complete len:478 (-),score=113.60 TRINITY_DN6739_c0_g1_i2:109-1542(-)
MFQVVCHARHGSMRLCPSALRRVAIAIACVSILSLVERSHARRPERRATLSTFTNASVRRSQPSSASQLSFSRRLNGTFHQLDRQLLPDVVQSGLQDEEGHSPPSDGHAAEIAPAQAQRLEAVAAEVDNLTSWLHEEIRARKALELKFQLEGCQRSTQEACGRGWDLFGFFGRSTLACSTDKAMCGNEGFCKCPEGTCFVDDACQDKVQWLSMNREEQTVGCKRTTGMPCVVEGCSMAGAVCVDGNCLCARGKCSFGLECQDLSSLMQAMRDKQAEAEQAEEDHRLLEAADAAVAREEREEQALSIEQKVEELTGKVGKAGCRCVEVDLSDASSPDGFTLVTIGGGQVKYPSRLGSHCHAWDDGNYPHACEDGGDPGKGNGWCEEPWCFVDPCSCEDDHRMETVSYLPSVMYNDLPLAFSYTTCGGRDYFEENGFDGRNSGVNASLNGSLGQARGGVQVESLSALEATAACMHKAGD